MEKSFQLDQKEIMQLQQMEQERTNALAAVGALSLDMETARENLKGVVERQRSFIRQSLVNRGVDRFENARLGQGAIIANVMDEPPATQPPPAAPRPNGPARVDLVPEK